MSEMLNRVAAALEQSFMDRIAASASTPEKAVAFAETGVVCPKAEVWQAYARAAVEAMREPTHAMSEAWARDGSDWIQEKIDDPDYPWRVMIDEALK